MSPAFPTPIDQRRSTIGGIHIIEHLVATDYCPAGLWVITGRGSTPELAHTRAVKWWATKKGKAR